MALELGERMTISSERVDDDLIARVHKHFSEDETVELVAIAGYENMRSKMNIALDRKSTRLNSSHIQKSRMPSSA